MGANGKSAEATDAAISEALSGGKAEMIREAIVELNGVDGTPEEIMSLLRHQRVAERTGLDPYTLSRLGDLGTVRLLATIPGEVKAAIQGGFAESTIEKRLGAATEAVVEAQALLKAQAGGTADPAAIAAAVVEALRPPDATPPWLVKAAAWLHVRWPAAWKALGLMVEARWPIWCCMGAIAWLALFSVAVSAGMSVRHEDAFLAQIMSTPSGSAALRQVFHPHGHPSWVATAASVVLDWLLWLPSLWLLVLMVLPWIAIAFLGFAKRGPAMRRLW